MPFTQRCAAIVVGCSLAATLVGACGSSGSRSAATGFCADIQRGHPVFDSTDDSNSAKALAAFDRLAASAPAAAATDLKTVSSTLSILYNDPKALQADPKGILEPYSATLNRVDRYLRQTCHIPVPKRIKLKAVKS